MLATPIFLTGASGFVGQRVVGALASAGVPAVRLLARSPAQLALPAGRPPDWRVIQGDLTEPEAWRAELQGVDTVIHLAARTGKGRRSEHLAANLEGTRGLVEAASRAGIRRLLFMSSKAAGYSDQRSYYYAQAKAQAEALVRQSPLEILILRPTMILGAGSAVLENLRRLATLPVPIVFGKGTTVQPIHVDDVTDALVAALAFDSWPRDSVDLGGPDVLPLTTLLARIRAAAGGSPRRPLHLPLGPIRAVLAAVEPVALGVLPFTAGQLAAFANDATATPHPFGALLPRPSRGIDVMING